MPKQYEAIRDALVASGKPMNAAQSEAAATYNKQHPGAPMGPHTDAKHGRSKPFTKKGKKQ